MSVIMKLTRPRGSLRLGVLETLLAVILSGLRVSDGLNVERRESNKVHCVSDSSFPSTFEHSFFCLSGIGGEGKMLKAIERSG